jgi:hypothetical protein
MNQKTSFEQVPPTEATITCISCGRNFGFSQTVEGRCLRDHAIHVEREREQVYTTKRASSVEYCHQQQQQRQLERQCQCWCLRRRCAHDLQLPAAAASLVVSTVHLEVSDRGALHLAHRRRCGHRRLEEQTGRQQFIVDADNNCGVHTPIVLDEHDDASRLNARTRK